MSATPRIFASDVETVTVALLPDDTFGCVVCFKGHASALEVLLPIEKLQKLVEHATAAIPVARTARAYGD